MNVDIHQQCQGRCAPVLIALGMDQGFLNGRHGDCFMCGDKRKNARWVKDREYYICSKCGSHSVIDLAIALLNTSYKNVAYEIRKIIGGVKMQVVPNDIEKHRKRILKIMQGRQEIIGSPVEKYLLNRGLSVLPEKDCYYHEGIEYWDIDDKPILKGIFPAMISVIRNLAGEGASLHVTYLTPDGKKADVESPKKILPVVKQLSGCAIQLFQPEDVLGIAEGIETALAVHELEGIPCWASGNANQMACTLIPENVKRINIYADSEPSGTGKAAAYTLQKRLVSEGRKAFVNLLVNGQWLVDDGTKMDFLDFLVLSKYQGKKQQSA